MQNIHVRWNGSVLLAKRIDPSKNGPLLPPIALAVILSDCTTGNRPLPGATGGFVDLAPKTQLHHCTHWLWSVQSPPLYALGTIHANPSLADPLGFPTVARGLYSGWRFFPGVRATLSVSLSLIDATAMKITSTQDDPNRASTHGRLDISNALPPNTLSLSTLVTTLPDPHRPDSQKG